MSRYKVVLANGCFDRLHYGHLIHLEAAKAMGSLLVVSITDDAHVNKGPGRPVYPDWQRAELVRNLKCVDDVLIVSGLTEALELVKPDILVKGTDYSAGLQQHHTDYCNLHGIQIAFTDTPKLSAQEMENEAKRRAI